MLVRILLLSYFLRQSINSEVRGRKIRALNQKLTNRLSSEKYDKNDCFSFNVSDKFCLPNIEIVGFPKAATSAAYHLLVSHQDTTIAIPKEYCFGKIDKKHSYFRALPHPLSFQNKSNHTSYGKNKRAIIVSCCLLPERVIQEYLIFKPIYTKYIFLVRNFADYMWAAYNFWCNVVVDEHCLRPGMWNSNITRVHKSPTLFHELIVGVLSGSIRREVLFGDTRLSELLFTNTFQDVIVNLGRVVGNSRVLVLASENISSWSTWQRLARFTGMNGSHKRWHDLEGVRVNTNARPGTSNRTQNSSAVGVYKASGYRPMLAETRTLLNDIFRQTCVWLKKVYNIHYNDVC